MVNSNSQPVSCLNGITYIIFKAKPDACDGGQEV